MSKYFEFPNGKIGVGDCLDYLRQIPSNSVPLTVTSPPYNIGKSYENVMPLDQYLSWCESWMKELYRITAPTGAFWLNLGYVSIENKAKAIPLPYLLWNKIPFFMVQEVVWNYGAGVASSLSFSPRNEKWLFLVKDEKRYTFNLDTVRIPTKYPNQKKNGKLKCNPLGKNPTDVWEIPKVTSGKNRASKERVDHPAQFPVAVIERIVKVSTNPGDLVLDPFMGSGSTAVAATKLGRKFLGYEIREDYCSLIKSRLENLEENSLLSLDSMSTIPQDEELLLDELTQLCKDAEIAKLKKAIESWKRDEIINIESHKDKDALIEALQKARK